MAETKKIAILMGGPSAERDVSLVSGREVSQAVYRLGYEAIAIDADRCLWSALENANPDIVFNALHGSWGEDGTVQGILETFGRPYTHSRVAASALAMDKNRAKFVLAGEGIQVPGGKLVPKAALLASDPMPPPYVVKPNAEGSSVGVFIIREAGSNMKAKLASQAFTHLDEFLVEPFIPGKELCVAVLGDKSLAVTEIRTDFDFYDYDAKYADGGSRHIIPADLPAEIYRQAMEDALRAHQALGCESLSRSDFRYDFAKKKLLLLEVNTQPGMTPTSLAPEQAAYLGMDFPALVNWLLEDALARFAKKTGSF